jgi:type I restriction-modification system DNA methylase subunit
MPNSKRNSSSKSNGATLDFESQLWAAADKLRGHMDSSEYKHVVLGLIFLKYISDSFEETLKVFTVNHRHVRQGLWLNVAQVSQGNLWGLQR